MTKVEEAVKYFKEHIIQVSILEDFISSERGGEFLNVIVDFAESVLSCEGWPTQREYPADMGQEVSEEEVMGWNACLRKCLVAHAKAITKSEEQHDLELERIFVQQSDFLAEKDREIAELKAKIAELNGTIRLWHDVFGTTQLTHAVCRLEVAEEKAKKFEELKSKQGRG